MFRKEKPIENISEDRKGLNRSNFAENLALNIENYFKYNNDCLTVGLMGGWGSGKTSLINLTKEYLKDSEIKIMNFNPWVYSSFNQLIEEFFSELILQFFNDKDSELVSNLKAYWFKLNKSDMIKSLLKIPVSGVSSELNTLLASSMDSKDVSLEKLKSNINRELENHKILCIIDDLDRLGHDEINEMFRLIKIMADFNNMIYLVSFDKEVISDSLDKHYGDKFLEKIINVPLDIPMATHDELKSIIRKDLRKISSSHGLVLDEDRLDSFFDFSIYNKTQNFGISYFFKNLRDIKRFINILEFNIELIKNEVNFVDFTVITAIQVFLPKVYEKIKHNESLLIEYKISVNEYETNSQFRKKEIGKFEELVEGDKNLKYILQRLFPKTYFIYHTDQLTDDSHVHDGKLLICSSNHFKTYFKLNPIVKNITEDEINQVIDAVNAKSASPAIDYIKKFIITDKLNLFFKSIPQRIDKIREPEFFLSLIFSLDGEINSNFLDSDRHYIKKTCLWLINKINSKNRFEILKGEFEKSESIYFLYKLINFIELNKYMSYDVILSLDELNGLKKIIEDKYSNFLSKYLAMPNINYLEIALNFEFENVENIIYDLISSKEGFMEFLNHIIINQKNNNIINTVWNFIGIDDIKCKIDENYIDLKNEEIVNKFLKYYDAYESLN